MFKKYKNLSNSDMYELGWYFDNLNELNIYEETDFILIKNNIRHIMEILLTD